MNNAIHRSLQGRDKRSSRAWLKALSGISAVEYLYGSLDREDGLAPFLDRCVEHFGYLDARAPASARLISPQGPLLAVANHPTGLLDGIVALHLLSRVRHDIAVLANNYLAAFPVFAPLLIPVDPLRPNRALLQVARMLARDKAVLAFPAGTVAHFQPRYWCRTDAPWEPSLFKLACQLQVPVLPLHINLQMPLRYAIPCALSRSARTVLLPRVCLGMQIQHPPIEVGPLLTPDLGQDRVLLKARGFAVNKTRTVAK